MQEQLFNSDELPDLDRSQIVAETECPPCAIGRLADELIQNCCGSHSLGLVYQFLRDAGLGESEARAEFELFLAGTPSEKFRSMAAQFVEADLCVSKPELYSGARA